MPKTKLIIMIGDDKVYETKISDVSPLVKGHFLDFTRKVEAEGIWAGVQTRAEIIDVCVDLEASTPTITCWVELAQET